MAKLEKQSDKKGMYLFLVSGLQMRPLYSNRKK